MSCPSTGELQTQQLLHAAMRRPDNKAPLKYVTPRADAAEVTFRHSGWAERRLRIKAGLTAACVPAARQDRFAQCGACAVIQRNVRTKSVRVTAWYCHDRWCVPCARARAADLHRRVACIVDPQNVRLVTLTLRHRAVPLADEIKRLRAAWLKLRKSSLWKSTQRGGMATVEIKHGQDGNWHVHAHVMTEGSYIPQGVLSTLWQKITGDSHVVDIRKVTTTKEAAAYVTKYVTKQVDASVIYNPELLVEAIKAMHHQRLFDTYGTWRTQIESVDLEDQDDWVDVCTMRELADALHRCEPWAIAMLQHLKRSPIREHDADESTPGPAG